MIVLVLCIRQAACHVSLVPQECKDQALNVLDVVKEKVISDIGIFEAQVRLDRLRGALEGEEKMEECAVCLEAIDEKSAIVLRTC